MSISTNLSESSGRDSPNRLKQELLKTATDKTGKKMMNPLKLPEIFSYFDTPNREKKWATPNADVTDYFNYGLTEETFKLYAQKVKNLFNKLQKTGGAHFKQSGDNDKFYEDRLPITHGGLEVIDDNVLKSLTEAEWDLLPCNSDAYLDLIFKQHGHLDDVCKGIKATNNSVNNVYGLKKDPPPSFTMQPPPAVGQFALPRPQPPPMTMHQPPPRMTPPPMGPPSMFPPPGMHHQMDFPPGYPQMMPRPPYMGYPPKPYEAFNPIFPQVMPNTRPPMEMSQPPEMSQMMVEKKPEKRKKEDESEGSDESSDEKEKGKSQSKTSERHKRSRSREKKHKHREKDSESHQEKHHSHHRGRHERDEGSRRSHGDHEERSSKRDHYPQKSSREREREEVKNEDSYKKDDGENLKGQGGRERRDWQKGFINNFIGSTVKEGRDRKDRRSSK